MSQRVPRPPPSNGAGPYRIAWWEAGPGDESVHRRTACVSQAEAEEVLAWLAADPANDSFRCSWQAVGGFDAIPF